MSFMSKVTFAGSVVFTASMVSYVHMRQKQDLENMRKGVTRDVMRQESRKRFNTKMLQDQQELTKILKRQRDEEDRKESEKAAGS